MDAPSGDPAAVKPALPRFIYITGCDGVGKTTQALLLLEQLRRRGLPVRRVWLRFPFAFSLPLLIYARLRGCSWTEDAGGCRHGYWDFRRSWTLRTILPWTLLLDAALAAGMRIYYPLWRRQTVVCERFVLDMLVDLSIAGGKAVRIDGLPERLFLRLLPAGGRVIILDLDAETVRERRADLRHDHKLDERLAAYRRLYGELGIAPISSSGSVEAVSDRIMGAVGTVCGPAQGKPHYAMLEPELLRRVFSNPMAALLSHWLFQSCFYLDRTERCFKLGLEAVLALLFYFPVRFILPPPGALVLAVLIAHTLDFLLNGHLWGVLKHYSWVRTPYPVLSAYARGLAERARGEPAIQQLVLLGSLKRGEWTPASDLDLRLLRRPGLLNGLRACWFLLRERTRALLCRFPLDCYLLDSPAAFEKLRLDGEAVDFTLAECEDPSLRSEPALNSVN